MDKQDRDVGFGDTWKGIPMIQDKCELSREVIGGEHLQCLVPSLRRAALRISQ